MSDAAVKGVIADIQRFSLHDGPGIRTTVFFKGCNLKCRWCHNPETVEFKPQILWKPEKCIGCGQCGDGCFSGAKTLCGQERSIGSILEEILLDVPYYGQDGGVTLSGGEPFCQMAFARELLRECRSNNLHTAVESNMTAQHARAEEALRYCNLLMADLKAWDDALHKEYTGSGNDNIKENIRRASWGGIPIILRTPVISGVNDSIENIIGIADFAAGLPTLIFYEMLPYHPLGLSKGIMEGCSQQRFEKPSDEHMVKLGRMAKRSGIQVRIAGRPV